MWTQWTHVDLNGKNDEWVQNEWKGVMYMVSGSGTTQPKSGFPRSANPKAMGQ